MWCNTKFPQMFVNNLNIVNVVSNVSDVQEELCLSHVGRNLMARRVLITSVEDLYWKRGTHFRI